MAAVELVLSATGCRLDGGAHFHHAISVIGIVLEAIEFCRNRAQILGGLHLSVAPGEYLTIAGPSGSGKTTLLRLIAGLETTQRGRISLTDHSSVRPTPFSIAFVFQGGALYPHLTVQQNLEFSLQIRGMPAKERKARSAEMASLLGLLDLMDRLPEEISGGEAQRVAIGRALMQKPGLLLLDEPLANLDGPRRGAMRGLLRRVHRELGITTIHVTHDQEEAMALGDRVALLHCGTIQQIDRPQNVYRWPVNRWAARFLGFPPINLAIGEVRRWAGASIFMLEPTLGEGEMLPDSVAQRLPVNTRLEVGLRPEHLSAVYPEADAAPQTTSRATLQRVEFTGTNTWWQMRLGTQDWMVRGVEHPYAVIGSQWCIRADWQAAVWFDPTTGKALSPLV